MPTSDVVAAIACLAALGAVLIALVTLLRMRMMRRTWRNFANASGEPEVVGALDRHISEVKSLRAEVRALRSEAARTRDDATGAIRHIAVVRYDAFGDMGGRLSFSAAMLDDAGAGLVLTSINGRSETRTYAKGISAGRSETPLSPEEEQAIGFARRGASAAVS